ncbi:MAG: type II toxin-antitoxin system PemK/MazF family toxin [Saprospiraceae bacterium]
MDKGTIVLTKFPFTDLSTVKRRPAIIISKVDPADPDVIVAFISSVLPLQPSTSDYILLDTHVDFIQTGLKKPSVFKMDKLATLDKSIFSGELGSVPPSVFEKLKEKLRVTLDL